MVATMTVLPFIVSSSVMKRQTGFLAIRLAVTDRPRWRIRCRRPRPKRAGAVAGLPGFFQVEIMMSLLIFIGEVARDAFHPARVSGRARIRTPIQPDAHDVRDLSLAFGASMAVDQTSSRFGADA